VLNDQNDFALGRPGFGQRPPTSHAVITACELNSFSCHRTLMIAIRKQTRFWRPALIRPIERVVRTNLRTQAPAASTSLTSRRVIQELTLTSGAVLDSSRATTVKSSNQRLNAS
jgi:hypothetical protein